MAGYGVIPEGFNRKPLGTILAEIEADMVTEFGPQVVQTSQSPFGQLNGVMAELIDRLWGVAQDTYQSYDVNQAEKMRLEQLARLRLLRRAAGETDAELRRATTNEGRAQVDVPDIERALLGVEGVTYAKVFLNSDVGMDANLLPSSSICAAVLGGDENELAAALRRFVVPGISTYGNTPVSTLDDGRCRSLTILRPILVPVKLTIQIRTQRDNNGCPPPSTVAVRDSFLLDMNVDGPKRLINGDDLDYFRVRSAIEAQFPNVEVLSFIGERDGIAGPTNSPVDIAFIEMATLATADVTVNAV